MVLLNVVVAQLRVKDEKLIQREESYASSKQLLKILCNCNFYRGKENLEKDQEVAQNLV